jgi:hypothetical protein
MKTIWKYQLPRIPHTRFVLPRGAEIIHVGAQEGTLFLWALVDTEARPEAREIMLIGTGIPWPDLPRLHRHLGTVQLEEFVWHVFELTPPPTSYVTPADVTSERTSPW